MCSNNNKSSTSTAAAVAAPTSTTMPTMTATALRGSVHHRLSRNMSVLLQNKRNTRAEFKRLKTILPSIRRKDNVSKLDIILEAIKYIDDLQDQLIDRLGGPRGDREATILALTAQASQNGDARLKDVEDDVFDDVFDHYEFDRHDFRSVEKFDELIIKLIFLLQNILSEIENLRKDLIRLLKKRERSDYDRLTYFPLPSSTLDKSF